MTTVYVPFVARADEGMSVSPRRRSDEHENSVVLLLDNGREGAEEILTELGASLVSAHLVGSFIVWRKPSSSRPVTHAEMETLGRSADLVVAGVGSCGACTAGSVEDAIRFERHGIPSALLITEAFGETADAVAEALGMPGYPHSMVPHPIGNRDETWWAEEARRVAPHVFAALTLADESIAPDGEIASDAMPSTLSPANLHMTRVSAQTSDRRVSH